MKKPVKWILLSIGIILGIAVIFVIYFMVRYSTMTKQMSPSETVAINDTVFAIKDRFVNAFLFKGEDGYLMIDACMSEKKVAEELQKLNISPEEVRVLLLTHSDGDHIGSVGLFSNAAIYLHKDEEQMINGTTAKAVVKYKWAYGDYNLVESNEILNLEGFRIKVIHTPGHTPGSCCFVINSDYLVTGDNLDYTNGEFVHFFDTFNMDTPTQEESIKSLPDPASFKYILTAHNGVIIP